MVLPSHPSSTRSQALVALCQDISALLSLSYETAASIVHDKYHASIGFWGLGEWIRDRRDKIHIGTKESGRGYAVVIVGADEPTGQSLTLHLAKTGYTVFPFVPLPSPDTDSPPPPTSQALSNILLAWSSAQKRLRAKYPRHCGQVVPVIVDPDNIAQDLSPNQRGDLKRPSASGLGSNSGSASSASTLDDSSLLKRGSKGKKAELSQRGTQLESGSTDDSHSTSRRSRFGHAGETVRAYCRENNLYIVAIICTPRNAKNMTRPHIPKSPSSHGESDDMTPGERAQQLRDEWEGIASIRPEYRSSLSSRLSKSTDSTRSMTTSTSISTSTQSGLPYTPEANPYEMIGLSPYALTLTDESTLARLYRSNVIDPLSVVKELTEFMSLTHAIGKGRARVIFISASEGGLGINEGGGMDLDVVERETRNARRVVNAARGEACRIMRKELSGLGIQVCEVVVGPMCARVGAIGPHLGHLSGSSSQNTSFPFPTTQKQWASQTVEPIVLTPSGLATVFRRYVSSPWRLTREDIIQSRYLDLSTLWAVDDALLFSSVRRAIEDRYPRARHNAGLTPILDDLANKVPGGGIAKRVAGWSVRGVLGWRIWDWVLDDVARL